MHTKSKELPDTPYRVCALLLSMYGLLRGGLEAVVPGGAPALKQYLEGRGLMREDLTFAYTSEGRLQMHVKLWWRKNGPHDFTLYGRGHGGAFDPVKYIHEIWLLSPKYRHFIRQKTRLGWGPMRASTLVSVIKDGVEAQGLDPTRYAATSLRAGGATMLLALGWCVEDIMLFAGWASEVARRYLRKLAVDTRDVIWDSTQDWNIHMHMVRRN
jgi:hypothetical protein